MNKNIISGGCSFTFGHELSDYKDSKTFSIKHYYCAIIFTSLLHPTVGAGERPTTNSTHSKPQDRRGRQRGHRLTGATGGRGVRARVGLSLPPGAGRGRGRARGSCLGSVSEPGGRLAALRSGRGRAGGTAQVIAKKSERGNRNSTPPVRKKLTSRRGGNASGGMEPKAPIYLSLYCGGV